MITSFLLKRSMIFALYLLGFSLSAQTSKDIIDKVIKAHKPYNNYDAEFESWFKFASSEDTSYSKFKYSVYNILNQPITGRFAAEMWNTKYYNVIASNTYCSFGAKDSVYYVYTFREHKNLVIDKASENMYKPFVHKSKFLKKFNLMSDTGRCYTLTFEEEYQDEIKNTNKHKVLINVDKQTWLIVEEEEWYWFEGKEQYSRVKLLNSMIRMDRKLKAFTKQCDSLIKVYKSYRSGDSISEIFNNKYATIVKGDKAPELKGVIHNSNDSFDVYKHKDSILILDFSYTTCAYCYLSIPALKAVQSKFKGQGVSLYSINQFKSDWSKIDAYEAFHKIDFPSVQVNYDYGFSWGVRGHPTFFIVKNGVICFVMIGYSDDLEDILIEEVEKLR